MQASIRPLEHIRRKVLGFTQAEMARVANTTQATVSRWEKGELEPDRDQLAMIRDEAVRKGGDWSDLWFFEVPAESENAGASQ